MTEPIQIDTSAALTPSELVFLCGEQFAEKVLVGNIDLMHMEAKVSMAQLGEAMLLAAFLGTEAVGGFRLEARQKKAVLGLVKVAALYADPLRPPGWTAPSLEAELYALAVDLHSKGERHEVRNIVHAWLGEDAATPWRLVFEKTKAMLAQRGMLGSTEETKLKIFTVTHYELPAATASLAASTSLEPIQGLLAQTEHSRPEIWKQLRKQVQAAIRDRKESDDDFD